ncbi:MAG: hypothetical protein ACETWT_02040 [Thermodesulfobacteriota bacterium]
MQYKIPPVTMVAVAKTHGANRRGIFAHQAKISPNVLAMFLITFRGLLHGCNCIVWHYTIRCGFRSSREGRKK